LKSEKIRKILKKDDTATVQNNTICFLPGSRLPQQTAGSGILGRVQDLLKHHGKLYYFLLDVFKPIFMDAFSKRKIRNILKQYDHSDTILNLGSGPNYYMGRKDIINIDIFAFDEVDIVADAENLPIENNSIDFLINIAMLEHVKKPESVVKEIYRIIKPGGKILCYLPFIQPFHAAPNDFQRWTVEGIKTLFSSFNKIEVFIGAGPTSGMLWILQEWLAILLSFGSKTLHDVVFLTIMVITTPIKVLDLLIARLPYAEKVASGFYVVGEKE